MKYPTLNIYIFSHTRRNYIRRIIQELMQVDSQILNEIRVVLLVDHLGQSGLLPIIRLLRDNRVNFHLVARRRYLDKSRVMSRSKSKLVMKLDEDIFMTAAVWERFLRDCFEEMPVDRVVAPVISSGIPGVELFLSTFSDKAFATQFREKLAHVKIPNVWGANYESLAGKYGVESFEDFFTAVRGVNHHYKGVHPLRFSETLQRDLTDYVIKTSDWKTPLPGPRNVVRDSAPYFCNSAFVTGTLIYKDVMKGVENGVFFTDGFDEVALNQLLDQRGRPLFFNRATAAIHPSYNTIGASYAEISDRFFGAI